MIRTTVTCDACGKTETVPGLLDWRALEAAGWRGMLAASDAPWSHVCSVSCVFAYVRSRSGEPRPNNLPAEVDVNDGVK